MVFYLLRGVFFQGERGEFSDQIRRGIWKISNSCNIYYLPLNRKPHRVATLYIIGSFIFSGDSIYHYSIYSLATLYIIGEFILFGDSIYYWSIYSLWRLYISLEHLFSLATLYIIAVFIFSGDSIYHWSIYFL